MPKLAKQHLPIKPGLEMPGDDASAHTAPKSKRSRAKSDEKGKRSAKDSSKESVVREADMLTVCAHRHRLPKVGRQTTA